jgi:hypothetical protein
VTPPEWYDVRFNMTVSNPESIDWERFNDALAMFAAVIAPDAHDVRFDGLFAAQLKRARA